MGSHGEMTAPLLEAAEALLSARFSGADARPGGRNAVRAAPAPKVKPAPKRKRKTKTADAGTGAPLVSSSHGGYAGAAAYTASSHPPEIWTGQRGVRGGAQIGLDGMPPPHGDAERVRFEQLPPPPQGLVMSTLADAQSLYAAHQDARRSASAVVRPGKSIVPEPYQRQPHILETDPRLRGLPGVPMTSGNAQLQGTRPQSTLRPLLSDSGLPSTSNYRFPSPSFPSAGKQPFSLGQVWSHQQQQGHTPRQQGQWQPPQQQLTQQQVQNRQQHHGGHQRQSHQREQAASQPAQAVHIHQRVQPQQNSPNEIGQRQLLIHQQQLEQRRHQQQQQQLQHELQRQLLLRQQQQQQQQQQQLYGRHQSTPAQALAVSDLQAQKYLSTMSLANATIAPAQQHAGRSHNDSSNRAFGQALWSNQEHQSAAASAIHATFQDSSVALFLSTMNDSALGSMETHLASASSTSVLPSLDFRSSQPSDWWYPSTIHGVTQVTSNVRENAIAPSSSLRLTKSELCLPQQRGEISEMFHGSVSRSNHEQPFIAGRMRPPGGGRASEPGHNSIHNALGMEGSAPMPSVITTGVAVKAPSVTKQSVKGKPVSANRLRKMAKQTKRMERKEMTKRELDNTSIEQSGAQAHQHIRQEVKSLQPTQRQHTPQPSVSGDVAKKLPDQNHSMARPTPTRGPKDPSQPGDSHPPRPIHVPKPQPPRQRQQREPNEAHRRKTSHAKQRAQSGSVPGQKMIQDTGGFGRKNLLHAEQERLLRQAQLAMQAQNQLQHRNPTEFPLLTRPMPTVVPRSAAPAPTSRAPPLVVSKRPRVDVDGQWPSPMKALMPAWPAPSSAAPVEPKLVVPDAVVPGASNGKPSGDGDDDGCVLNRELVSGGVNHPLAHGVLSPAAVTESKPTVCIDPQKAPDVAETGSTGAQTDANKRVEYARKGEAAKSRKRKASAPILILQGEDGASARVDNLTPAQRDGSSSHQETHVDSNEKAESPGVLAAANSFARSPRTQLSATPTPTRPDTETVMIFCKRDFMRYQAGLLWRKYQEIKRKRSLTLATVTGRRARYLNARYQGADQARNRSGGSTGDGKSGAEQRATLKRAHPSSLRDKSGDTSIIEILDDEDEAMGTEQTQSVVATVGGPAETGSATRGINTSPVEYVVEAVAESAQLRQVNQVDCAMGADRRGFSDSVEAGDASVESENVSTSLETRAVDEKAPEGLEILLARGRGPLNAEDAASLASDGGLPEATRESIARSPKNATFVEQAHAVPSVGGASDAERVVRAVLSALVESALADEPRGLARVSSSADATSSILHVEAQRHDAVEVARVDETQESRSTVCQQSSAGLAPPASLEHGAADASRARSCSGGVTHMNGPARSSAGCSGSAEATPTDVPHETDEERRGGHGQTDQTDRDSPCREESMAVAVNCVSSAASGVGVDSISAEETVSSSPPEDASTSGNTSETSTAQPAAASRGVDAAGDEAVKMHSEWARDGEDAARDAVVHASGDANGKQQPPDEPRSNGILDSSEADDATAAKPTVAAERDRWDVAKVSTVALPADGWDSTFVVIEEHTFSTPMATAAAVTTSEAARSEGSSPDLPVTLPSESTATPCHDSNPSPPADAAPLVAVQRLAESSVPLASKGAAANELPREAPAPDAASIVYREEVVI